MTMRSLATATALGLAASLWSTSPARAQAPAPASPGQPSAPAEVRKSDTPATPADASKPQEKAGDSTSAKTEKPTPKVEQALFGGGCFWCLEAFFERVHGVKSVVSGFAGGRVARPSYEMVCTGLTDHAEVVRIDFDPSIVSYDELLDIFWICHDPTTLNRQGPDEGTQYRSVIFYADEAQKKAAFKSLEKVKAAGLYANPIVTQIMPPARFWPAEGYHQDYYRRNPSNSYCQAVIAPKLAELRAKLKKASATSAK